jgi:hypothetical protein
VFFIYFFTDIVEFFYFTFDFFILESREVPPSSDEAGRAETRSFGRAVPVATAMRPGGDSEGGRQAYFVGQRGTVQPGGSCFFTGRPLS